jgi:riboflavin kinase/FMN adenylyltransferase
VLSRVATGSQLGRELGYPTLNLPYPAEKVKPPNGVYAAFTDGYASAVNLGVAPTMGRGSTPILESHLLEVPEPVPRLGDEVWVELMEFIRPERRFDGVDALREQIGRDCEKIREILQLQVRDPSRASRLNWFESK